MRTKKKRFLGSLLSLALILGLMPGMSLTAYADNQKAYAAYDVTTNDNKTKSVDALTALQVKFNGKSWYIIADDSTAVNAGTVTLLAAESFGNSEFHDSSNKYSTSTIKTTLYNMTASGGSFAGVASAINTVKVKGSKHDSEVDAKLYLLNTTEASNVPENVRMFSTKWWLRSPGIHDYVAACVIGGTGDVYGGGADVFKEFGVRPALKLNLSSVIFSSVNLSGGANATASGGSSINNTFFLNGSVPAMTTVTYTANSNYQFPKTSDYYTTTNGITVTRTSDMVVTVFGTPTGVADVAVPNAIPTYTVTFKVVNGTWSDGSTTDKKETVADGSKPASVPTGMKASEGYTGGAWDTDPASATITGAKTFTYTFTEKEAATVTKAPEAKSLTYNGSAQELVTAGTAEGGTMQYALGTATEATEPYTTSIPTATNAGTYYVWYKVEGDANHNNTTPACINVKIAEANTNNNNNTNNNGTGNTERITISTSPASVKAKVKKKKNVTVSWKKIKKTKKTRALRKKIKSIQVQYADNKTFTSNLHSKKVGKTKTKVTFKLKRKKTYYVRARYVGNDGCSRWSKVKKIKTK